MITINVTDGIEFVDILDICYQHEIDCVIKYNDEVVIELFHEMTINDNRTALVPQFYRYEHEITIIKYNLASLIDEAIRIDK